MRFAVTTLFSCMLVAFTASADGAPDKFSGFIGGGIGVKPDYLGSDHSKLTFIPAVKVDYGPFFVGGVDTLTALGWKFYDSQHWQFSLGAGADLSPRQESDNDRLRGMGDIDVSPHAFLAGSYKNAFSRSGMILTQDIGGNQQGLKLYAYSHLDWQLSEDSRIFFGPRLSWGNADYMQTQFGVSAEQSSRSGLQRYEAGAGLQDIGLELGIDYQISPSWMAGFRATALHLEDEAADSPVVQDNNQLRYGLFFAWKF
ncbi:MipA/OmpV family protein [Pantoea sp. BAV 3049]|uniref:MipA/OmpV family protein n=1 Tax=Pantoea sp. BAV 3049 TaxID=2654188 RepID=UPI00131BC2AA|nr:MipA/OmpV family protein [Pantoea sp. BAV 3049]